MAKQSSCKFYIKNWLFGATNVLKNSDKAKWVYFGYGIALDQADLWNFGNGFSRNIVIFGVNDSSSSHSVKVLGEGPTSGINSSFSCHKRRSIFKEKCVWFFSWLQCHW